MNANELNVPYLATLEGSFNSNSVAFHPTARLLATGSQDKTVNLWRLSPDNWKATTCVATLKGHRNWVNSVAFDPTGTLLATGSQDKTVKLWQLSPDKLLSPDELKATTLTGDGWVYSVAFDPTRNLLATCNPAKLWRLSPNNLEATTCVETLEGHSMWVTCVAFHPTARLLATGSEDTTAKLWRLSADYSSATCVATLKAGRGRVTSLGFDPTGTVLATCNVDGTKLWDCRQFIRKNVTDDFRAMHIALAKKLVGDSVKGHMSMKGDITQRVALGKDKSWLGVDPYMRLRVIAHLKKLYRMSCANSVPFNPACVRLNRQLLLNDADSADSADSAVSAVSAVSADSAVSEKTEGGSRVRPRSKSKSKMMKRKRTTLKRKPPK